MTVPQLLALAAVCGALSGYLTARATLALIDHRARAATVRRHPSGTRVPAPRGAVD